MSSHHITRRHILLGPGALVVATAADVTWRAADQDLFSPTDGPAFAAWQAWRTDPASQQELVAAALLAANAHNTQPWIFRLAPDQIDLHLDEHRDIGAVDPLQREVHLSLGCALENLVLTAQAAGLQASVRLRPDPTRPAFAARVRLTAGAAERPALYDQIPHRHTNRHPYITEPLPTATLRAQ